MDTARRRLLFVCSRNRLRSPTAEKIFGRTPGLAVRSRGLSASAVRRLSADDVEWADVIFVMEPDQKKQLLRAFRDQATGRPIQVLDIPDEYGFMDPELVALITAGVEAVLAADGRDDEGRGEG